MNQIIKQYSMDTQIYQVVSEDNSNTTVCMILKVGAKDEEIKYNGCAHILEHMSVHYIQAQWNAHFGERVQCSGITEYNYMILRIDWHGNEEEKVKFCNSIFQEIVKGRMLCDDLFLQSIDEVGQEYIDRKAEVEEQRNVISLITDGTLVTHPVGAEKSLKLINYENVERFCNEHYPNSKLGIIIISNRMFNLEFTRNKIQGYRRDALYETRKKKVKLGDFYIGDSFRCFFMEYSDLKLSYLERILLIYIYEKRLNQYGQQDYIIYNKEITEDYRFLYVKGRGKQNIKAIRDIVKDIEIHGITESELEKGKSELLNFVNICKMNKQVQSYTGIIEMVVGNFVYNDELLVISEYDMMYDEIKKIKIQQINRKICK